MIPSVAYPTHLSRIESAIRTATERERTPSATRRPLRLNWHPLPSGRGTVRIANEPAALFFTFSRAEYLLGDGRRVLPLLVAQNQARSLRLRLSATRAELEQLRDDIADNKVDFLVVAA